MQTILRTQRYCLLLPFRTSADQASKIFLIYNIHILLLRTSMPTARAKFMKLAFILLMFLYIQTAPTEAQMAQTDISPHKKHLRNKHHVSKSKDLASDDEQTLEQEAPRKRKRKTGKKKQSIKQAIEASQLKNSPQKIENHETIGQKPGPDGQQSQIKINDVIVYQPDIKQYNGKTTEQNHAQGQNKNKNEEKKVAVVEKDQNKINQLKQKSKNNDHIDVQRLNKAIQQQNQQTESSEQKQTTQTQSDSNDDGQKEVSPNQQYERRMAQYKKAQDEKYIRQQKILQQYRAKESKAAEQKKLVKEEEPKKAEQTKVADANRGQQAKRLQELKKAQQLKKKTPEQMQKEAQRIREQNKKKFDLFMQERYDPESIIPVIPKNAEEQRLMKEKQMHKRQERQFLQMNLNQNQKKQLEQLRKIERQQYLQQKAKQQKKEAQEKEAEEAKRAEQAKRTEQTKRAEQAKRAEQNKKALEAKDAQQAQKKMQEDNKRKFDEYMQEKFHPQTVVPKIPKNAQQQRLLKEKQMHKRHQRQFMEMNMAQDQKYRQQQEKKAEQKRLQQQQEKKKKAQQQKKQASKIQDENMKKFDQYMQEKFHPQTLVPKVPKNTEQQRLMKEKQMHKRHERQFMEMNMAQDQKYRQQQQKKKAQQRQRQEEQRKKAQEERKKTEQKQKRQQQEKQLKSLQKQITNQHQSFTQLEKKYTTLQSKLDEKQRAIRSSQNQLNQLKMQFSSLMSQFKQYKSSNEESQRLKRPQPFVPVQTSFGQNGIKSPKEQTKAQKDIKKPKLKVDSDPQLQLLQKVMQNRKKKQLQVQQRTDSLKQANKTISQTLKPQDKQSADLQGDSSGVIFYVLFTAIIAAILYLRKKNISSQNPHKSAYPSIQSKGSLIPDDENES